MMSAAIAMAAANGIVNGCKAERQNDEVGMLKFGRWTGTGCAGYC